VVISRSMLLPQYSSLPIPKSAATVPFTKPIGPPPPRPPRPDSLDDETIAFMQQSGMRMVVGPNNRASNSTVSSFTPRSHSSSIEAHPAPTLSTLHVQPAFLRTRSNRSPFAIARVVSPSATLASTLGPSAVDMLVMVWTRTIVN
jgi:hypothetical protein